MSDLKLVEISPNFDTIHKFLIACEIMNDNERRFLIQEINSFPINAAVDNEHVTCIREQHNKLKSDTLINRLLNNDPSVNLDAIDESIVLKLLTHPKFTHLLQNQLSTLVAKYEVDAGVNPGELTFEEQYPGCVQFSNDNPGPVTHTSELPVQAGPDGTSTEVPSIVISPVVEKSKDPSGKK